VGWEDLDDLFPRREESPPPAALLETTAAKKDLRRFNGCTVLWIGFALCSLALLVHFLTMAPFPPPRGVGVILDYCCVILVCAFSAAFVGFLAAVALWPVLYVLSVVVGAFSGRASLPDVPGGKPPALPAAGEGVSPLPGPLGPACGAGGPAETPDGVTDNRGVTR
jgi:hypothetical protein